MKNTKFFLILTCMTCLFYTSCEKTGLQITTNNDNKPIQTRGDCEECPDEDECCCAVWLDASDIDAYLRFCGTSDGASACSGGNFCGTTFTGGGQQIILSSTQNPGQIFCMGEGNPFYIFNYHMMDVANIVITCQNDLTNPDTILIRIQPQETFYFETNASCELDPC